MSGSWGHEIRLLSDIELAEIHANERYWENWAAERRIPHRPGHVCTAGKCKEAVTHRIRYQYVTGAGGRSSYAEKDYCPDHASRFALTNKLEYPEPVPTLAQRMVQVFREAVRTNEYPEGTLVDLDPR